MSLSQNLIFCLLVISVLFSSTQAISTLNLPQCSACLSGSQCQSRTCSGIIGNRKCVRDNQLSSMLRCGFKAECQECTRSSECATQRCYTPIPSVSSKCIFRGETAEQSLSKCFPNQKVPNCAPCTNDFECASNLCFGYPSRCVEAKQESALTNCGLKNECDSCSDSVQCTVGVCWSPNESVPTKCTENNNTSRSRCFPNSRKGLCSECFSNFDCSSGRCRGSPRRCISTGSYEELRSCGFRKECKTCSESTECATRICSSPRGGMRKRCIFGTDKSISKCFGGDDNDDDDDEDDDDEDDDGDDDDKDDD